jgi:hypothetical protein
MPADCYAGLDLPDSATYADGAKIFLECLAEQTSLTWPGDFPRKPKHSDPA